MKQFILTFACLLIFYRGANAQITFTAPSTVCANQTITLTASSGTVANAILFWTFSPAGVFFSTPTGPVTMVSFPVANVYTIAVSDINSVNYAIQTITVLPSPTLVFSQNNYTSCINANVPLASIPVSLSVSGSNSYTWSLPPVQGNVNGSQNIVTPTVSTCYSVSSQNTLGCTGTATTCISILPRPAIQVTPTFTFVCRVGFDDPPPDITLSMSHPGSATGTFSYSWSGLGILSSPQLPVVRVYPSATASYTAELRNDQGCVALPVVATVSVETCTGIEMETEPLRSVFVYPNPAQNKLYLSGLVDNTLQSIKLHNAIGKFLIEFDKLVTEIDLREFPAGIYFLQIDTSESGYVERVIKQ